MAVNIVDSDLTLAPEEILGHQVNCKGKMNSGVAKQIRRKFPRAFTEYEAFVERAPLEGKKLLGSCQVVNVGEKWIANLFGQDAWGYDGKQYTDYKALRESLQSLRKFSQDMKMSVALPYKIGSDRGGADWSEVLKIIEEEFEGYEVTLYRM